MIVVEENNKTRIDSYLSKKLDISRSKVQKLIEQKKVLVNGKETQPNYKVKENDKIDVEDNLNFEIKVEKENIPIDIVYEDKYLLIINKESGMVTHPAPGHYTGTLVNALLYKYDLEGDTNRPGIVHRLDKDTSGLMVVAKDSKTLELLSDMMKHKKVKRHYLALVEGIINHETGTIDAPIGRNPSDRKKMAIDKKNGKRAVTHYKVLEQFGRYSYIECQLETGRTHQIRVHFAAEGHPLYGDWLYGKENEKIGRPALHCAEITLFHPDTKEKLCFSAPLPEDMRSLFS